MTHVIVGNNVNTTLHDALWWLRIQGVREETRNGPVLASPQPVVTETLNPTRRVLFCAQRNANPFFHLLESLWMMAGRQDLAWVTRFNAGMSAYSDDGGVTQPAAYGYRWRNWFGQDQLLRLVELLKKEPDTRRAVLGMWDANKDLGASLAGSADVPCNTHAYFDLRGGRLNLSVLCRSNDALWGCYGANVVHFSILQEWLAAAVGVDVGVLRQYSHNLHVYESVAEKWGGANDLAVKWHKDDRYAHQELVLAPLVEESATRWLIECEAFVSYNAPLANLEPPKYTEPFFTQVAQPMIDAWRLHKSANRELAMEAVMEIWAEDWREACAAWLQRAWAKKDAK